MPSRLTVTVGDVTLLSTEASEQVFGVVRQIAHESYSSSDMQNDIMLIELDVSCCLNRLRTSAVTQTLTTNEACDFQTSLHLTFD